MIHITDTDIKEQGSCFVEKFLNSSNAPFLEEAFVSKAFPILEQRANRVYPYEVRLPKSLSAMVAGDFEPTRVLTIKGPIKGPFSNVWFGDTTKGVRLRTGYRDGDSRYIADQGFYDTYVHGLLGGATGQGKSVTLNAMIYGMCMEYAPWELHLTLSDAKIVEFKSIALSHRMPHIEAVSATGDADYLISVLEAKQREMQLMNSIFVTASRVYGREVKNVADFRKVTGLALPRNVLIFDEYQAMFKAAKRKAGVIATAIDDFGRRGRNTGYHIFLASQEVGADIPKETLNQISLRASLGASGAVSELILGNDAAKLNKGKLGRLLFNSNFEQHSALDNVLVRVPFMSDKQTFDISDNLIDLGKKFRYEQVFTFYDEQDLYYEEDYYKFVDELPYHPDIIYLGEPAFVLAEKVRCLKLQYNKEDDIDNLIVVTNSAAHLERYFKMLKHNVLRNPVAQNIIICANSMYTNKCGAEELSARFFFEENSYDGSQGIAIAKSLIFRRKLCVSVDNKVFVDGKYNQVSDEIFYGIFERGCAEDTVTNRSRCFYLLGVLETDVTIIKGLDLDKASSETVLFEKKQEIVRSCIQMYTVYGCDKVKLEKKKLPAVYTWILGADRMVGLIRDSRNANVSELKTIMLEAPVANVRFITFTTTMENFTEVSTATHWFIMDDLVNNEVSRCAKCEVYPEQKSAGLGVLFDTKNREDAFKFKKMFLEGEIPII